MVSESSESPIVENGYPRLARLIVVVSVLLTCLGYLHRYSNDHLRAFSQVYFEWGFSERTAEVVVIIMKATLVLALVSAPFRKLRFLTIPAFCALLFELICLTLNAGVRPSYLVASIMVASLILALVGASVEKLRFLAVPAFFAFLFELLLLCLHNNLYLPYLTPANQALRLAPFALILVDWNRQTVIRILKFCIAATFIGHGIEALTTYAEFVDYLLVFFRTVHLPIKEATAATILHVIGTIDILLGHHLMNYHPGRTKWVLRYMMIWGAATALMRILYYGFGAWHEVAIRNAHFLIVYLLILFIFHKPKKEEAKEPAQATESNPE